MFAYFFAGRKKQWSPDAMICISLPVTAYFVAGFVGTIVYGSGYSVAIKNLAFWILPLLFVMSLYIFYGEKMPHIVDMQFLGSCLAYLIPKGRFILETITVESMFAYVYGAFFVYYTYKKKWVFCGIAALLMFLTDKRIVVLAVLVAVFTQFLVGLFKNDKRISFALWGITGVMINVYLWLIYSGTLEAVCRGIGLNTNGRVKMYGKVAEWFDQSYFSTGKGFGIVELLLDAWKIEKFSNLHNDLLKLHIELGVLGLLLFLASYGLSFYLVEKKYGTTSLKLFLSLAVYTMLLFSTDNVSIYIIYLIPVYSIYFAVLSERDKEKAVKKYDEKADK